ncbi:hypothetical protein OOK60_02920 [Trichothermofontia sichuanensis B231]|uniref:hypothetical protein n=1 Tax=Trichothermofontia sichuanensis TaxID=3045816 RepID=UPI002245A603|nr:hypothetical protein [Trichothermofontia sichuanensis]UZQ55046.1 hypothetical protein OOK60_02920 [Trichothermofontia sichuanensis B231]
MNPPSEKVSQTPQSSASSPTPPSEPAATPMEESPTLRSPKRPATPAKSASKSTAKSGLEIVSHSSAKAKATQAASQDSPESTERAIAEQATTGVTRSKAKGLATVATAGVPKPKSAETSSGDPGPSAHAPASAPPPSDPKMLNTATTGDKKEKDRSHPISPPSEPMQYRAIGLIRGRYQGRQDHVTKGVIHAVDGAEVDAVLLGRVISLVKKHIDLDKEHLWVVYPRTREEGDRLHVQIVGIWEPESLSKDGEEPPPGEPVSLDATALAAAAIAPDATATPETAIPEAAPPAETSPAAAETPGTLAAAPAVSEPAAVETTETTEATETTDSSAPAAPSSANPETDGPRSAKATPVASTDLEDGFFSIRGEVVHASQEDNKLVIKIRQQPRKQSQRPKAFKLTLRGTIDSPKLLRHFWEIEAQRQGNELVVQKGTLIGVMPPVKKKAAGDRAGQKKRHGIANKKQFKRPRQSAGPEKGVEAGTSRPSGPTPKPMKKRPDSDRRSPKVPRNPL